MKSWVCGFVYGLWVLCELVLAVWMFGLSSVRQAMCGLVIMCDFLWNLIHVWGKSCVGLWSGWWIGAFVCKWMRFMNRLPFCIALVAVSVLLIHSQYLYMAAYSPKRTKQLRIMLDMVKWKFKVNKDGNSDYSLCFKCCGFIVAVCSLLTMVVCSCSWKKTENKRK